MDPAASKRKAQKATNAQNRQKASARNVAKDVLDAERRALAAAGKQEKSVKLQSLNASTLMSPSKARPSNQDAWLRSVNPYYATLRDPVNCKGARIPDMMTTPSATFSVTFKGELTANSAGFCGVQFGGTVSSANGDPIGGIATQAMLIPTEANIFNGSSFADAANSWLPGCEFAPGATAGNVFNAVDLGISGVYFQGWASSADTIPQTFSHVRLVSACLTVAPTGNALNSSGRMIGVSCPRLKTLRSQGLSVSVDELDNFAGSQSVYINASKAINVSYAPMDPHSWEYAPMAITDGAGDLGVLAFTEQQIHVEAPTPDGDIHIPAGGFNTLSDLATYSPGELWVAVTGAQSGQPFQYIMTANYEGICRQANTMLLTPKVSHADPIAAATALNAIATSPKVEQGNTNLVPQVAKPLEHTSAPAHTPMLSKIVSGIGEVGKVAAKFAPELLSVLGV